MRKELLIGAAFAMGCASFASAQDVPYSQTLESQMQRVEAGQTPVPPHSMRSAPAMQPTSREWPADASAPAPAPVIYRSVRQPVAPDGEIIHSLGSGATPAMPLEIRTTGDVRYITGGVGDEESAQLKMVEHDYNFRLLLTGNSGAYISGAMVRIMASDGRILLSTDGAGPFLYATLPAGSYNVEVTAPEGGIKSANVTVPATGYVKPVMRFSE